MPGYPDWQKIQQWLGTPVVANTGRAIPVAPITDGPFNLASWASVVVAIKPTGGNVTVTVSQSVQGAPASLVDQGQIVAPAGQVTFASFVLFGDAVSLTLQGAGAGVTADYALYPSNTTTNAKLLASAVTAYQKNGVAVASESVLDLIEGAGIKLTLADDPTNTRMHLTIAERAIADVALSGAAAASIDIQNIAATWAHLRLLAALRSALAANYDALTVRFNADAGANYNSQYLGANGSTVGAGELVGGGAIFGANIVAATAVAGRMASLDMLIAYPEETGDPITGHWTNGAPGLDVSGGTIVQIGSFGYKVATAPVSRITVSVNSGANLVSGSRVTLEGTPTT